MKKNSKGFTLIELLVVVAIIGILAAVGVVAYNGYTNSAKINAIKTLHAQTLKYVQAEVQKCTLEGNSGTAFNGTAGNCKQIKNKTNGANAAMTALIAQSKDKNPHDTDEAAIKNSSAYVKGQVSISASGKVITIKSCYDDDPGCSGDNISGPQTVTIE